MAPSVASEVRSYSGYGLIGFFVQHARRKSAGLALLLFLFGLFEGLGLATLLPFLESLLGSGAGSSAFSDKFEALIGAVGLSPSLELYLALFVGLFAIKACFGFGVMWLVGIAASHVAMELRLSLLSELVSARWLHIAHFPKGFVSNALSAEADRVAMGYRELVGAGGDAVQVLFYLTVAVLISWQTALLALVAGFGIAVSLRGLIRGVRSEAEDMTIARRELVRRLTDALPSMKSLKSMGQEEYLVPALEGDTRRFFRAQSRAEGYRSALVSFQEPILVAVMAVGLWAVVTFDLLAPPTVLVLAAVFYRLVMTTNLLQRRFAAIAAGEASFQSINSHIETARLHKETWRGSEEPPARISDSIHLAEVGFAYGEAEVLHGVSLEIPAGQLTVLKGPSGAGKSTIMDLVLGLIPPSRGLIHVDGTDLRDFSLSAWRTRIGYVPQDILLFSDSVRKNVSLGNPKVSDELVRSAIRDAGLSDVIDGLPEGLDTLIGEGGVGLSGGQKQRLAIARALAQDPILLVLDEPTASLDGESAQAVCRTIEGIKHRLCILAVSHEDNLSAIADRTYLVQEGKASLMTGHSLGSG